MFRLNTIMSKNSSKLFIILYKLGVYRIFKRSDRKKFQYFSPPPTSSEWLFTPLCILDMSGRVGRFSFFKKNHLLYSRFHCGWPLQATFSFNDFSLMNFALRTLRSKIFDPRSIIKKYFFSNIVMFTHQKPCLKSLNSDLKRWFKSFQIWFQWF